MIGLVCDNPSNIDVKEFSDNNITIFSSSQIIPDNPRLSLFSKCMSYHFEGVIVTTSLRDTLSVIDNSICEKKVFWVDAIVWHKNNPLFYRDILKVFHNMDIKILAKDENIFNILKSFIREPDGIMGSIDIEKILEV
tara:strand:+ start:321 stop:731 length:411 start_codon:yes stop_codon:yes gene_type:complete